MIEKHLLECLFSIVSKNDFRIFATMRGGIEAWESLTIYNVL